MIKGLKIDFYAYFGKGRYFLLVLLIFFTKIGRVLKTIVSKFFSMFLSVFAYGINIIIRKFYNVKYKEYKGEQLYEIPQFSNIQENIREKFIKENWKIVVVNRLVCYYDFQSNDKKTVAFINKNKKKIVVSSCYNLDGFYHEFGHFIDYHSGNMSKTKEFAKAMQYEIDKIGSEYCKKNAQEFFAEVYSYSINDYQKTKYDFPMAMEVIEEAIDMVK